MTDDQLTDLATLHLAGKDDGDTLDLLPLLRAAVAAERERCAKVCEATGAYTDEIEMAHMCADAIRET